MGFRTAYTMEVESEVVWHSIFQRCINMSLDKLHPGIPQSLMQIAIYNTITTIRQHINIKIVAFPFNHSNHPPIVHQALQKKAQTNLPKRCNSDIYLFTIQGLFQEWNIPFLECFPIGCCTSHDKRSILSHEAHEFQSGRRGIEFCDDGTIEIFVGLQKLDKRISASCGWRWSHDVVELYSRELLLAWLMDLLSADRLPQASACLTALLGNVRIRSLS